MTADNDCPHFDVILDGRVYYEDRMAERYYCNCCGASWEGAPFYPEPVPVPASQRRDYSCPCVVCDRKGRDGKLCPAVVKIIVDGSVN